MQNELGRRYDGVPRPDSWQARLDRPPSGSVYIARTLSHRERCGAGGQSRVKTYRGGGTVGRRENLEEPCNFTYWGSKLVYTFAALPTA